MAALAPMVVDAPSLRMGQDGVIRVGGTRVTLDIVLAQWLQGATCEQIAQDYDSLSLADINAAVSYYLTRRGEVDAYLERNRKLAEEARRQDEERFPSDGIRARLLARRTARS